MLHDLQSLESGAGPHIDSLILRKTLHWLIAHQNLDGSFAELYTYEGLREGRVPRMFQKLALTSQIMITLAGFDQEVR